MDLVMMGVSVLVGFLVGFWFNRYMLKKDPAKLERWIAEAKALERKARSKFDSFN